MTRTYVSDCKIFARILMTDVYALLYCPLFYCITIYGDVCINPVTYFAYGLGFF
jgi:hypothetical protein